MKTSIRFRHISLSTETTNIVSFSHYVHMSYENSKCNDPPQEQYDLLLYVLKRFVLYLKAAVMFL